MNYPTSSGRKCVDIQASVHKHSTIIDDVLPAHVLSGCETVSGLWGIGKETILKVVMTGQASLKKLGNIDSSLDEVKSQAHHSLLPVMVFPMKHI